LIHSTPDRGDDAVWVGGPDEGLGIGILFGDEAVDGSLVPIPGYYGIQA
jgi:hypothetical protein